MTASEDSLGYRRPDTAQWEVTDLPGRRRRVTVRHRPLAGLHPQDLLWWWSHVEGTCLVDGLLMTRFRAWHPRDHVLWEPVRVGPDGLLGPGSRVRVVEAFDADPDLRVDVVERVERLDERGVRLVRRRLGLTVATVQHTWSAGHRGTECVSVLEVGSPLPGTGLLNLATTRRALPTAVCRAWVRHTVEETGRLERLVPAARQAPSAADTTSRASACTCARCSGPRKDSA